MYNRIEALRQAISDGAPSMAMIAADFFLQKGKMTQAEFDELEALAYPTETVEAQEIEVVEGE